MSELSSQVMIPYDEIDVSRLTKMYYMMGEVADMFGLPQSMLRFWEKEIGYYHPKKNRAGDRLFTPADIEKVKQVYYLVRIKRFTIEGARQYLKENKGLHPEKQDVKSKLRQLRNSLWQLRQSLDENSL